LTERGWSLTRRLTLWIALATALIVLTFGSTSVVYLHRAANEEIDTLTETTIKDLRLRYQQELSVAPDAARGAEVFRSLADKVAENSEYPIAWRIWNAPWGIVKEERGRIELLTDRYPSQTTRNQTMREGNLRWRTEPLRDELEVGLVLDGSPRMAQLRNYEIFAGVLLVGCAASGLLIGWFFLRRATNILERIADSARRVQEPAGTVDVDITGAPEEIRSVVDAMHDLLGNIQAATERHRVLYASMAHELRAPIQNLVGATEVALLSRRDADAYRKVLESNLDELRELGDAIDNLMTICAPRASPAAGRVLEDFDLVDEAKLRLARERAQAERRGISLRIATGGETRLCGDRESVLRAVRNLVANAIEWSARGDAVEVSIEGSASSVSVTVDDAGPGVPLEQRAKIFDPFYRGPSAHGRRVGYGLGLAIVRDAAERHGGSIAVDRSPAGGARFCLVIPREAAHEPALQRDVSPLTSGA
jgi:signal transduction histidine kinase